MAEAQERDRGTYGAWLDARTRLLTAYDVMDRTGLGYESALALVKVHGVRLGTKQRQYRITEAALARALTPPYEEG